MGLRARGLCGRWLQEVQREKWEARPRKRGGQSCACSQELPDVVKRGSGWPAAQTTLQIDPLPSGGVWELTDTASPWLRTAPRACTPGLPSCRASGQNKRPVSTVGILHGLHWSPRRGADGIPLMLRVVRTDGATDPHGKPGRCASPESTPSLRGLTLSLSLTSAAGRNPPPGHRCHVKERPLFSTLYSADILIMRNTGVMKSCWLRSRNNLGPF